MSLIHKGLENGGWGRFNLLEQMANIGSEVARTITRHEKGDTAGFNKAVDRALELFDLTIGDERWHGPKRREICRAREVFCDLFFGGNSYKTDPVSLDKYFLEFARAARFQRSRPNPEPQIPNSNIQIQK